jgi:hypothetical protein
MGYSISDIGSKGRVVARFHFSLRQVFAALGCACIYLTYAYALQQEMLTTSTLKLHVWLLVIVGILTFLCRKCGRTEIRFAAIGAILGGLIVSPRSIEFIGMHAPLYALWLTLIGFAHGALIVGGIGLVRSDRDIGWLGIAAGIISLIVAVQLFSP